MRLVAKESGVTRSFLSSYSLRWPHPELIVREIKRNYANSTHTLDENTKKYKNRLGFYDKFTPNLSGRRRYCITIFGGEN